MGRAMKRKPRPAGMSYAQMVGRLVEPAPSNKRKVKRKAGKTAYLPVMRTVVEHSEDQSHRGHLMPGRYGKRWEYADLPTVVAKRKRSFKSLLGTNEHIIV